MDGREIAEAFSGHRFEEAWPHLSPEVVWDTPGAEAIHGRDAVIAACRATTAALSETRIEIERFVVIDGGDSVAVDTRIAYRDEDGLSTVASCDVYELRDGRVVRITSYAVEVPPDAA